MKYLPFIVLLVIVLGSFPDRVRTVPTVIRYFPVGNGPDQGTRHIPGVSFLSRYTTI